MRVRLASVCAAASCLALLLAGVTWAKGNAPSPPEKCGCFGPASTGDYDGDGVADRVDHCGKTPKGCDVDAWGCETDADGDGVCDGNDRCANTSHGQSVDAKGCSQSQRAAMSQATSPPPPPPPPPPAHTSEMERELVQHGKIRLENLYFEKGKHKLLPESEESLDEAGRALEKYPNLEIEVQGHTDTRGSAAFNKRLSQDRAESVRAYLLDHFHLKAGNITAKGYGESDPETRERNDEELVRNRRVILSVQNPEDLPKGIKVENKP